MRWIYRRYWLLRGWFESKRKNGCRGEYGSEVLYLDGGQERRGVIVSDRCGRATIGHRNGWHSTVILREDGRVQFGGAFTTDQRQIKAYKRKNGWVDVDHETTGVMIGFAAFAVFMYLHVIHGPVFG